MGQRWFVALIAVVVVSAGLVLAACGGGGDGNGNGDAEPPPAAETPAEEPEVVGDPDVGETLFLETCSACHGQDARGLPNLGRDLVTSTFIAETDDAGLLQMITQGRDVDDPLNTTGIAMPPKGGNPALDDEDIQNIIAFLRTINAPE